MLVKRGIGGRVVKSEEQVAFTVVTLALFVGAEPARRSRPVQGGTAAVPHGQACHNAARASRKTRQLGDSVDLMARGSSITFGLSNSLKRHVVLTLQIAPPPNSFNHEEKGDALFCECCRFCQGRDTCISSFVLFVVLNKLNTPAPCLLAVSNGFVASWCVRGFAVLMRAACGAQ